MAKVIDSCAFSDFCGVDSGNQVPSGDTLGRFRNILVQNQLQEKLFAQVVALLLEKGLILKKGTIVGSTIISAPLSMKNRKKQRDPEAHSVKKGNTWHFGYKAHVGVDKDSGYLGAEKREDAVKTNKAGKQIRYKINRRPSRIKKGSARSQGQLKRREHEKSSVRAKVEHVFAVVKGQFRYRKTRYRGLRKQAAKLNMMFALANLISADRPCLAA